MHGRLNPLGGSPELPPLCTASQGLEFLDGERLADACHPIRQPRPGPGRQQPGCGPVLGRELGLISLVRRFSHVGCRGNLNEYQRAVFIFYPQIYNPHPLSPAGVNVHGRRGVID